MSNTISSSMKTVLIDRVENSIPIKGITSRGRRVIYQCKNLLVRSAVNITNLAKKIFLKQRKINVNHYAAMHASISLLRHEIEGLKKSLPSYLNNLKNKISNEIDTKLNEMSADIHAKNNKIHIPPQGPVGPGAPLKQLTADPQSPHLQSETPLLQLTEDSELVRIRIDAELGAHLPNYDASEAEIAADQQRRSAKAEARADAESRRELPNYIPSEAEIDAELGAHLPNYDASEAEIAADQQRRSAKAEARADAESRRELPNYIFSEAEIVADQQRRSAKAEARANAELGAHLPNYDASEAEIAADQQRRSVQAEAKAHPKLRRWLADNPRFGILYRPLRWITSYFQ